MSETDDTDDLLLIPPDLFAHEHELLETYGSGAYFDIVDNLITHVNVLENRINYIQKNDSINYVNSLNSTMDSGRNFNSADDLIKTNEIYINSAFSTPQKPRNRFRMNSLPSTPSTNLSPYKSDGYNQARNKTHMLREIDNFINNVENVQINNAARQLNYDLTSKDGLNIDEVESMLGVIDLQRNTTEARLRAKEIELSKHKPINEVIFKDNAWIQGNNINSVPNYGHGMRDQYDLNASRHNGAIRKLTTSKIDASLIADVSGATEANLADKSGSLSSSDSTQTTARHKDDVRQTVIHSNVSQFQQHNARNLQMLSLNDLWGKQNGNKDSLIQKLQEEKMRRQHCEQLIQDLQGKILELHEKLAVAVQVDETKDNAIHKFFEAFENVSQQLEIMMKEKQTLEQELELTKQKSIAEIAESIKKVKYHENEASKALHLAHGNQDKLMTYEKQSSELSMKVIHLENQLKENVNKNKHEIDRNKQLAEIIAGKEIELDNGKSVLQSARKEIAESKKAVEICQAEFASMKAQYTQLELLLNDKQDVIKGLESQRRALGHDNENLKLLQKKAEDDVKKSKENAEKTKIDLKNFYQEQVEIVVRDKLKEFQMQLDKAESSLTQEIKNRELAIARTAAGHIQQLAEKHTLEVDLIEEKHKEEIRLYSAQLSDLYAQINDLKSKLNQQNERRANVAEQLHKVMEAQWMEAMKIINNGKSPIITQDPNITLDQLNSLKTKSYTNVEEVLSSNLSDDDNKINLQPQLQNMPGTSNFKSQFTYRMDETPKLYRGRHQINNDLQKYVTMLLNSQSQSDNSAEMGNGDRLENPTNDYDDSKNKHRRHGKPPWK